MFYGSNQIWGIYSLVIYAASVSSSGYRTGNVWQICAFCQILYYNSGLGSPCAALHCLFCFHYDPSAVMFTSLGCIVIIFIKENGSVQIASEIQTSIKSINNSLMRINNIHLLPESAINLGLTLEGFCGS